MADLDALYCGGPALKARIANFIAQSPNDSGETYRQKKAMALWQYNNYSANALNYYTEFLFSHPLNMRDTDGYASPFYSVFAEDATGTGEDLQAVLLCQLKHSLIEGNSFSVVEFPEFDRTGKSQKDFEDAGADRATIRKYKFSDVVDLEHDDKGALVWIEFREQKLIRPTPLAARDVIQDTFTFYDSVNVTTFQITYPQNQPPADTTEVNPVERKHNLSSIPVVELQSKGGCHLMEQLMGPQVSNWQARFKRAWLSNTQACSVPVIKSKADASKAFGRGTYIQIDPTDDFTWTNPPSAALKDLADEILSSMLELFRVASLRFMGDETGNSMPWRSAASLSIVQDTGHVNLKAYGKAIREHAERIYQLISDGRGEAITWDAIGFEHLEDLGFAELVIQAQALGLTNVYSDTFKREFAKRLTMQALPDLSESVKDVIDAEIDATTTEDLNPAPLVPEKPPTDAVKSDAGFAGVLPAN